jgi:exosortase/archaeosortase family protein
MSVTTRGPAADTRDETTRWRAPGVRFVAAFVIGTGTLLGVYHYPFAEGGLQRLITRSYVFYAHAAGALARVVDPSTVVAGNTISGRFSVSVSEGCDAIELMIPLIVAILSFPARPVKKMIGFILATSVVVAANIVRIASLYLAGARSADLFEFLHIDVWPVILLALCLMTFLLWSRGATHAEVGPPATSEAQGTP